MSRSTQTLPDPVHRELVQALFVTLPPTVIMSGLFLAVGTLGGLRTHDPILIGLTALGMLFSLIRIAFVLHGREIARHRVEPDEVRALERGFAYTYLPFALALGLFSARLLSLPFETFHTLAAVLGVGYAAGVAAGVYVRPWIAVPSMLLAVVPVVLVSGMAHEETDRLLALALTAFMLGGISSTIARYRSEAAKIEQRHRLATFSRQDALTTLPNRLALIEEFEFSRGQRDRHRSDWLLCVDLDGFGALNLRYGQTVGDTLLKLAAARIGTVVGERGLPVRLGDDEFCILLRQPENVDEVDWIARRMLDALNEPCDVGGRPMQLTASIGYVRATPGATITVLIEGAESAMREVRKSGGNGALEARSGFPDTRGFDLGRLHLVQ
jgi:diguanylate cyclase